MFRPRTAAYGIPGAIIAPALGSVASMSRVLVTGMSGTGKSSALAELGRRGYRVVDTDDPGWSEWVASPGEVGGGEYLWVEDRMTELLDLDDSRRSCAEAQEPCVLPQPARGA